jgi:subtilisin family serine protease
MMVNFRGVRVLAAAAAVGVLAGACSKDTTPPELSAPSRLVIVSGDDQEVLNAPAAARDSLVVRLLDKKDEPVPGAVISWAASDPTATLSSQTSTTNGDGVAWVKWTLGERPGLQTVRATSSQVQGASAVFQARNVALGISGGVSVASGLPIALSIAAGGTTSQPSLPAGVQTHRSVSLASGTGTPEPVRRLVVRYHPVAAGLTSQVATSPSALARSQGVLESAVAAHRDAGVATNAELSPSILASRLTVAEGLSIAEAVQALRADPSVASVMVDELVPMLGEYSVLEHVPTAMPPRGNEVESSSLVFPNDPFLLESLWHYNMVDAPRAWATTTGSSNVVVAVIDDGIRFDHPAIAGNLTSDGYNFVAGGNRLSNAAAVCGGGTTLLPEAGPGPNPTATDALSFNAVSNCWRRSTVGNHGLHVAGTIGAGGNDGLGVTGLNWNVRIRPVRVLDITGSGSWFDVAQGILYAAGLPASDGKGGTVTAPSAARIINMSLGGSGGADVLRDAVAAAVDAGSLIVASAGNSQSNAPSFPASYPGVLSVVALGPDLQLSSYTNVGPTVSISAPGGNFRSSGTSGVVSTTWDFTTGSPNYAYYQGTSMAAPHVAGVAALVLSVNAGMTGAQLRARLQNTAVPLAASGRDDRFGFGLVNAYRAVSNITAPAHSRYVRLYNAASGDTARTLPVAANGSFNFSRLAPGSYFVVAGEDEGGDGRIGVPGRRFGWFGGPGGAEAINLSAAQNPSASVSVHIGTPREWKPNGTIASANRLLLNSYVVGFINDTHPEAYFVVQIPTSGSYTFETAGILGTCGFGIELDTNLALLGAGGTTIAQNDNTVMPGSGFCSRITQQLNPGTYHLRVTGSAQLPRGQFVLSVRR